MHKFSIGFLLIVTAVLGGCTDQSIDEAELQARLIQLTTRALDNQVFIEGATFTMGDFGAEGEDGVWRPYFPPTIEEDRPHEVGGKYRSEEHTSELQSRPHLVCRLLLE